MIINTELGRDFIAEISNFSFNLDEFISDIPKASFYSLNQRLNNYNLNLKENLNLFRKNFDEHQNIKFFINIFVSLNAILGYLEFIDKFCEIDTTTYRQRICMIKMKLFSFYPDFCIFAADYRQS